MYGASIALGWALTFAFNASAFWIPMKSAGHSE
jgi:hypothetical protein